MPDGVGAASIWLSWDNSLWFMLFSCCSFKGLPGSTHRLKPAGLLPRVRICGPIARQKSDSINVNRDAGSHSELAFVLTDEIGERRPAIDRTHSFLILLDRSPNVGCFSDYRSENLAFASR